MLKLNRRPRARVLLIVAFALLLAAVFPTSLFASDGNTGKSEKMTIMQAAVLGVVEGVTEYLPVSSTGHLVLTNHLLGLGQTDTEKQAIDSYIIIIQGGAILAVLLLYWGRVKKMVLGVFGKDPVGRRLALNTLVAFVPAAAIGLKFGDEIEAFLFKAWPVTAALLIGGVAILFFTRKKQDASMGPQGKELEDLNWQQALGIGAMQCFSLWPGTSRSLMTIVGGLVVGLSTAAAVEFSFILGLVTLTAATGWKLLKGGSAVLAQYGLVMPIVGFIVAGIAAFISVKWMIGYLNRHSLAIFGWYRVAVGVLFAVMIVTGMLKV